MPISPMDIEGYATQDDAWSPKAEHHFLPIGVLNVVDGMVLLSPHVSGTTSSDHDEEVDKITSGVLMREYFYYEKDDRVYALADSERLKEAGDGAIPGFVCNEHGDYYQGNLLSYGPLMEIQEWVGI